MNHILVVDDTDMLQLLLVTVLSSEGFAATSANDGVEALESVRADPPRLILLDVSMPRMDGVTFLSELRKDPMHGKIPVIMLTATVDQALRDQCEAHGVHGYLIKSNFSRQALLDLVRQVIPAPDAARA